MIKKIIGKILCAIFLIPCCVPLVAFLYLMVTSDPDAYNPYYPSFKTYHTCGEALLWYQYQYGHHSETCEKGRQFWRVVDGYGDPLWYKITD